MLPKIFVGSSVEGLNVAYAIQENLEYDAEVTIWSQGIFKLSGNTLSDLEKALNSFDYAVFVFTPDDEITLRQDKVKTVRDNVIFELGLFIGKLSREKVFFVLPDLVNDLHLPTDLIGVTPGKYKIRQDNNFKAALGPFCNQLRQQIKPLKIQKETIPSAVKNPVEPKLESRQNPQKLIQTFLTTITIDQDFDHKIVFHEEITGEVISRWLKKFNRLLQNHKFQNEINLIELFDSIESVVMEENGIPNLVPTTLIRDFYDFYQSSTPEDQKSIKTHLQKELYKFYTPHVDDLEWDFQIFIDEFDDLFELVQSAFPTLEDCRKIFREDSYKKIYDQIYESYKKFNSPHLANELKKVNLENIKFSISRFTYDDMENDLISKKITKIDGIQNKAMLMNVRDTSIFYEIKFYKKGKNPFEYIFNGFSYANDRWIFFPSPWVAKKFVAKNENRI